MSETLAVLSVALPAAAVLLSAGLVVFAWRGRRVDDHPICRKCGFDLFGKPEGATVCSECGADLTRPRAVGVGRREKRRRLIQLAAPVLLVCVAWLALVGWGAARGTDWNKHKPAWWLMRDARSADAGTRDAALGELVQRVFDGRLSQQGVDALVDLALEVQGDPSKPWADAWGEAVGAARDAGKLAPERWNRYARQGLEIRLDARPTLRRGDPLVVAFVPAGSRVAPRHSFRVTYTPGPLRAGDVTLFSQAHRPMTLPVTGGLTIRFSTKIMPPDPDALAALPDGPHMLRSAVRVQIADNAPGAPGGTAGDLSDETVEVTAPITLLPAGAETVKLRTDPELKAAVEKAFTVRGLVFQEADNPTVEARVMATNPPVAAAFRAFVRAGGREWELGTVHFAAGRTAGYSLDKALKDMPGFHPGMEPMDVVLKPSVEVAVATVYLDEIWGGEVVVTRVPPLEGSRLSRRPPATRPAASGERPG